VKRRPRRRAARAVGLVAKEGGAVSSRRSGKTLLVWERPTLATAVDHCIG